MTKLLDQDRARTFRILISDGSTILMNMVYVEVGHPDYEIFGAFLGGCGGDGFFHQKDFSITVAADPADFNSVIYSPLDCSRLIFEIESLRSEFEVYDQEGVLVGLSDKGLEFLNLFSDFKGNIREAFSHGASEDFIYDIQDYWNLKFYKD